MNLTVFHVGQRKKTNSCDLFLMYFIINIIILCKFVLTLTIKTCILWYKSVLKMYYITHVIRHRQVCTQNNNFYRGFLSVCFHTYNKTRSYFKSNHFNCIKTYSIFECSVKGRVELVKHLKMPFVYTLTDTIGILKQLNTLIIKRLFRKDKIVISVITHLITTSNTFIVSSTLFTFFVKISIFL